MSHHHTGDVELEVRNGKKVTFNPDTNKGAKKLLAEYEDQARYAVRDWYIRGMDESDKLQLLRIQTLEAARYFAIRELGRVQDPLGNVIVNRGSYDKLRSIQWDNVLKEEQRKANRTIKRGSRVAIVSIDQPIIENEDRKLTLHDVIEGSRIKTCDDWSCDSIEELKELESRISEGQIPLDRQEEIKQKLMNFVAWSSTSLQLYEFKRDTNLVAEQIRERLGEPYREVFLLKRAGLSQKSIANLMRLKKKIRVGMLKKDSAILVDGKIFSVVANNEVDVILRDRESNKDIAYDSNVIVEIEKNRTEGSVSQLVEVLKRETILCRFFGLLQ